jgi:hypothetical protein
MFGRQPGPDDLVLPVAPGGKAAAGSMRKAHNSWLALQQDLDALGLRRRRAHDLRRTMISLTRDDGARVDVLKTCTHGASKAVIDLYTTFDWKTLCAEVAKLNVRRLRPAEIVPLRAAACAGADDGLATPLATARSKALSRREDNQRPQRDLNPLKPLSNSRGITRR